MPTPTPAIRLPRMIVDKPLVVCLTGAAGQIAYALLPALCDGSIFGVHQV